VVLREYLPDEMEDSETSSQEKFYQASLQLDYSVKLGNYGTIKAQGS